MLVGLQITAYVDIYFTTLWLLDCDYSLVGEWREEELLGSRLRLGSVTSITASIFVFKVRKMIIGFELDGSNIRQFHLSFTHFALLYKKWSSAFLHWPSCESSFILLHGTLNNIGI